jgi:hypothetical protein
LFAAAHRETRAARELTRKQHGRDSAARRFPAGASLCWGLLGLNGTGSRSGTGTGCGTVTGTGSRSGSGTGSRSGSGTGTGNRSGSGTGTGNRSGTGSGTGSGAAGPSRRAVKSSPMSVR